MNRENATGSIDPNSTAGVDLDPPCSSRQADEVQPVAEWNGKRFAVQRIDEFGVVIIAPDALELRGGNITVKEKP